MSQPIFSLLEGNREFLAINGASRKDIVFFALVVAFGPPIVAVTLQVVGGLRSPSLSAVLHLVALWFFGSTAAMQVVAYFDPSSRWALLLPAGVSYAGAIAYSRWSPVRSFLSVSAALPVAGMLLFVVRTPLAVEDAPAADIHVRSRTPVVLVVFDEFATSSIMRSDGSIDALRFPGFGRLARDSTWHSRATSVHYHTTQAVPAILTGELPRRGALPTLGDLPHNLFTLLGRPYAFRVQEMVTRLCPTRLCPDHLQNESLAIRVSNLIRDVGIDYLHATVPTDLRRQLAPVHEGWAARFQSAAAEGTDSFVRSVARTNPLQTLYFMHLLQPHIPWSTLPSGNRYNDGSFTGGFIEHWAPDEQDRWRASSLLVEQGFQRHLLQIGHLDRFVNALLDRLVATGLYDRALVIVTADHGVSFRAGGPRRPVTAHNVSDIAAVPLFVKYPGQKHGREDRRVAQTIDVLPTIADVLDVRLPWRVDGRSLLDAPVDRVIRVARNDGPPAVMRPRAFSRDLLATAARNAAWLGEGADSLYEIGPRKDLLGRPVSAFLTVAVGGAAVRIPRLADLDHVNKASGYVPAHFLAGINWASLRAGEDVAIAINGRVAAVTRPFRTYGEMWVDAMVDESLLHDGRNTVGVYAVRRIAKSTRLLRLGGSVER